jgi:hypothetical protein
MRNGDHYLDHAAFSLCPNDVRFEFTDAWTDPGTGQSADSRPSGSAAQRRKSRAGGMSQRFSLWQHGSRELGFRCRLFRHAGEQRRARYARTAPRLAEVSNFAAMIGTFTDGLPEPFVHQSA